MQDWRSSPRSWSHKLQIKTVCNGRSAKRGEGACEAVVSVV